jgi:hypothetical protein
MASTSAMNKFVPVVILISALALTVASVNAQQVPSPRSGGPTFERGTGPVIAIDEAHNNAQRSDSRGLVELLQDDGYRVRRFTEPMTAASLTGVDVLVISNPGGWEEPSASLNEDEVSVVIEWVRGGGSLLLVLDHTPGPRNAARLTGALGVRNWHDGYAMIEMPDSLPVGNIIFWRSGLISATEPAIGSIGPAGGAGYQGMDAVLGDHPITDGRGPDERVRRVATFVGSAFEPPPGAEALLRMPRRAISLTPSETPGALPVFTADTPRTPVGAWLQGAVMRLGEGRVALFGEAGLFSGGPAADNRLFVLNLLRWLCGHL